MSRKICCRKGLILLKSAVLAADSVDVFAAFEAVEKNI